ncbi:hypothetical protein BDV23DRAFT_186194 [Aspergillus alliaceus]|uniref:Uncharacterized protein n=1 Tax=Petromyces alliaceus TaxID=209559 RepID=A0A5N7C194_PETAA|nr:hypothetical protein BDV23DRAFT_186194 [Aspergillus alliaceus]
MQNSTNDGVKWPDWLFQGTHESVTKQQQCPDFGRAAPHNLGAVAKLVGPQIDSLGALWGAVGAWDYHRAGRGVCMTAIRYSVACVNNTWVILYFATPYLRDSKVQWPLRSQNQQMLDG